MSGRLGRIPRVTSQSFSVTASSAVFIFSNKSVQAAEGDPIALRISPLSYDLQINPGEEKSGKIYIENTSDAEIEVQAEFSDFFVDDAGGYIFSDEKEVANENLKPYLMRSWFALNENNFTLGEKENKTVGYEIRAPGDASLGGHYGVIASAKSASAWA